MKTRIALALVGLSAFLTACEDEGNPGDDSLLSGASLIVVLIIAAIVVGVVMMRRRT